MGTRNPQSRSILFLRNQLRILKSASPPLVILSGLARGIDATAHRSALESGLPTIAIVGSGLDRCYPTENQELRDQILAADGLLISEFPPGATLYRSNFLRRNRIIAGWSRATWVVEAGFRSGALNTAKWAREQNRICLATPGFPGDASLGGNQVLLDRDHALPYWNVHSLGAVWLELASVFAQSNSPTLNLRSGVSTRELTLIKEVERCTETRGGISVHELFDWATKKNWELEGFYQVLESLVQQRIIHQTGGIFLKG